MNEPRLIDANALFDRLFDAWGFDIDEGPAGAFMDLINKAPTIAVEPVRHAHWENECCSACHVPAISVSRQGNWNIRIKTPCCPNCGARMNEREEERP